jgi:hypothetical protein
MSAAALPSTRRPAAGSPISTRASNFLAAGVDRDETALARSYASWCDFADRVSNPSCEKRRTGDFANAIRASGIW